MKSKSRIHSILLVFISILCFIINCSPCENIEIKRVTSPNGKMDFILFERDCGATTDFSIQGAILKNGQTLPSDVGNAIIMGSENYINQSNISLYPTWINDSQVRLEYTNIPKIYHQHQVFGVTVITENKSQ